ncbi:MAG: Uma2 family endonuclease [Lachnospiraceae bacterium]|nr:Uma2 family endonuclease [Lachnospiraceae bacterium]
MEALRKEISHTVDDIYALPEGERAERIEGEIYYMAPSGTAHQRILNFIGTEINLYIRKSRGDCEVFPAPFAVFLNENNKNYVEPDISVICDRDKITDRGCEGAPDWVTEIVSPGSRQIDYFKKLFLYRMAGVREYWVVDPDKGFTTVYNFEQDTMREYRFGEDVPAGIYGDLSIRIDL